MAVACSSSRSGTATEKKLSSLINEYKGQENFEVIELNPVATSALKSLIGAASISKDDRVIELLRTIKGIKKVTVVEYEDCDSTVREEFAGKAGTILSKENLLVEVKDKDDRIEVYGEPDNNNGNISNPVLFIRSDHVLIFLKGTIGLDSIYALATDER